MLPSDSKPNLHPPVAENCFTSLSFNKIIIQYGVPGASYNFDVQMRSELKGWEAYVRNA